MVSTLAHFIFGLSFIALFAAVSQAQLIVPTDLQGSWTSLGCYVDVGRTLTDGGYDDEIDMTDESCVEYCDSLGFLYAGTGIPFLILY
jgi:hypothetical protein